MRYRHLLILLALPALLPLQALCQSYTARTDTTRQETIYNATIASTEALAANQERRGCYLQNISDTTIYMSFGKTADSSKTAVVAGAALGCLNQGVLWTGAINVIHGGSGNKQIVRVEW